MRCAAETEWDWLTNESVKADEVTNLIHGFMAMTEGVRGRQRTTIERMNERKKDDVMILDLLYHASCCHAASAVSAWLAVVRFFLGSLIPKPVACLHLHPPLFLRPVINRKEQTPSGRRSLSPKR